MAPIKSTELLASAGASLGSGSLSKRLRYEIHYLLPGTEHEESLTKVLL